MYHYQYCVRVCDVGVYKASVFATAVSYCEQFEMSTVRREKSNEKW